MKASSKLQLRGAIRLRGAREHPLQSIDLDLPLGIRIVVMGVSGSGKSALAFHTIAREGLRRFLEASAATHPATAARTSRRLAALARPKFTELEGLPAVIAVGQGDLVAGPRATLGEIAGVMPALRVLFSRFSKAHCPNCNIPMPALTLRDAAAQIFQSRAGRGIRVLAPIRAAGSLSEILFTLPSRGITRAWIRHQNSGHSEIRLDEEFTIPTNARDAHAVVDRLVVREDSPARLWEALERAVELGGGIFSIEENAQIDTFATARACPQCGLEMPQPAPSLFLTTCAPGRCENCLGKGCNQCGATGWSPLARSFRVEGHSISDCAALDARNLRDVILKFNFPGTAAARELREELVHRLDTLDSLGLGAIAMVRPAAALSTGESQRARCAAAFGARVRDALFIFDEPTVGLHAEDRRRFLLKTREVAAAGNTVLLVEHDLDACADADLVIELGPGAGSAGGKVIFCGPPDELLKIKNTPTARALAARSAPPPAARSLAPPANFIQIRGARGNNLKNIHVKFPVGRFSVVTGVSGSGKSSLIFGTLAAAARRALTGAEISGELLLPHDGVDGLETFERRVVVGPRLPARSARSTPASYLGMAGELRELLAATPAAKARGLDASHFSANRAGWRKRDGEDLLQAGRCEACAGLGFRELDLELLESVTVTCEVCRGSRFSSAALEVKWKGRSIADWYSLTMEEAARELATIPKIARALAPAIELGIGYLQLGARADRLSGGELQRLQIARELARTDSPGAALILLDEPARGLHPSDIGRLLAAFHKLCASGHTVIAVEHSLQIAREAEWIVDIGPGAGAAGGSLVYEGEPAEFIQKSGAVTARALRGGLDILPKSGGGAAAGASPIVIEGAHARNLQNINLQISTGELTCIAGPAGSGKTALACDVLGAAARGKFIQALAPAARRAFERYEYAGADRVSGTGSTMVFRELPDGVAWGEAAGILPLLRGLFVHFSMAHCPQCGREARRREPEEARDLAMLQFRNRRVRVTADLNFGGEPGAKEAALRGLRARGYARVLVDGVETRLENATIPEGAIVRLVVDRLVLDDASAARCLEALEEAGIAGGGRGAVEDAGDENSNITNIPRVEFDRLGGCTNCKIRMDRALRTADFDGAGPGGGTWAGAARVAGECWPPPEKLNLQFVSLILQKTAARAPEGSRPLIDTLARRAASVAGLAADSLPLADAAARASTRASWMAAGISLAPSGGLVILDDPTRGLDESRGKVILQKLRDAVVAGCTVVVASADPAASKAAAATIALGPGAGPDGGRILSFTKTQPCVIPPPPADAEMYFLAADPAAVSAAEWRARFADRRDVFTIGFDAAPARTPAEILLILQKIASLYARVPEARALGLDAARFDYSLEKAPGRCELCRGSGFVAIDFDFLPGENGPCPSCGGARFEARTLSVRLYGRTIAETLQLSISAAAGVFSDHPSIAGPLENARRLGLGHYLLSQPAEFTDPPVRLRLETACALARDPQRTAVLVARAADGLYNSDLLQFVSALHTFAAAGGIVVMIDPRELLNSAGRKFTNPEHALEHPAPPARGAKKSRRASKLRGGKPRTTA